MMKPRQKILFMAAFFYSVTAFAVVPGQVNFQGVLLDNTNQLVNGSVDFAFAMFDDPVAGTQLWSETQPGITVTNGAYTVALGSSVPIDPAVLAGGAVYLAIVVNGDLITPRQRLLAVPYALEAENANTFGGVESGYFEQIFQHTNYDGELPPNDDPLEGLDDVDGDGRANFIDSDNDGDGLSDSEELALGTGINLVTPRITTVTDTVAPWGRTLEGVNETWNVTGTGFLPGMTVQVGPESPVPQNLTDTSFEMEIGAGQTIGLETVTVTNPNAETDTGGNIDIILNARYVFVSNAVFNGGLNASVATADSRCNAAAAAAGLPGTFMAWFSDSDAMLSAKDRFTYNGAWMRMDGTVVANDLADLTDGTIQAPINLDEYGNDPGNNPQYVATNTWPDGQYAASSCTISSPSNGVIGNKNNMDQTWTHQGFTLLCATDPVRYYCFQM